MANLRFSVGDIIRFSGSSLQGMIQYIDTPGGRYMLEDGSVIHDSVAELVKARANDYDSVDTRIIKTSWFRRKR